MGMEQLSHMDAEHGPRMVDVGAKPATDREAVARGRVTMRPQTLEAVRSNVTPKGDVLSTARIAGIMAAKRTHELIPMCHPLALSFVGVDLVLGEDGGASRSRPRCGRPDRLGRRWRR